MLPPAVGRGQDTHTVLVNFVLMIVVLLGCAALCLDVGMFELKNLQLQNAADAAALSGMTEYDRNNVATFQVVAKLDAAANGFVDGVNNTTVTITNSPAGYWANDHSSVQATVTQKASPLLSGIISSSAFNLSATAVATAAPCGYFLGNDPNYPSFWAASNGIYATCPLYASRAITNDYFANTNVRAVRVSGPSSASSVSGSIPAPYWNAPAMTDPLAWMTSPAFTACDPLLTALPTIVLPKTLNPGTYCGGINILDASVTMTPGLYIVTGGMTWTGATVTGVGVTIFLTKGGGYQYGQFVMQQDSLTSVHTTVNLTAPLTNVAGGVPGVVLFGDRNWVSTNPVGGPPWNDIQLYASYFLGDGIWYVPSLAVNIQGTFGGGQAHWYSTNFGGIVAKRFYSYYANNHWYTDFSSLPGGNPFHARGSLVQ